MPRNAAKSKSAGIGKPPHNGPANGAGWGGPAKGAGNGKPKTDFNAQTNQQRHHGGMEQTPENKRGNRREQAERLKDMLYDIASDVGQPAQVRVAAIDKFVDRVEGRPVALQVPLERPTDGLSDADLAKSIETIRAAIAGDPEGAGSGASQEERGERAPRLRPLH